MTSLLRFLFAAFASCMLMPALQAQQTIPHLDGLNRAYGQSVEQNLLQVVGLSGAPDPTQWLIYSRDPVNPQEVIEYTLSNGQLTRARRLKDEGNQTVIRRANVKVTPRRAFQQAEREAVKAKVGFHSANYSLANSPTTGQPEWVLTIKGAQGESLGTVRVSAVNGRTTGVTWRAASGSPEATAPPTVGESASEIGEGVLDLGRGIGRGLGRGFNSVGDWLQRQGQ